MTTIIETKPPAGLPPKILGLPRRTLLHGAAALAALGGPTRTSWAGEMDVYINTYGGIWTDAQKAAYFDPLRQAQGINSIPVTPVSFAKLKAQVMSGVYDWDVTSLGDVEYRQAVRENLLEPVDQSLIDPKAVAQGRVLSHAVSSIAISSVLTYRTDKFTKESPSSWADFWDVQRFPGPRSLQNQGWTALAFALLADGVPLDKIYPLDLDRGFRKLDQIKPHIKVWWEQGTQSQQLLRDGEVVMIGMWNSRAADLMADKVPVKMVWDGAETAVGKWVVAKGSPRAKLGWRFIDFVTSAKPQAEFCRRTQYGPSNPDSFALLPPAMVDQLPGSPHNKKIGYEPNAEWLGPHLAEIKDRFAQWLAS